MALNRIKILKAVVHAGKVFKPGVLEVGREITARVARDLVETEHAVEHVDVPGPALAPEKNEQPKA